MGKGVLRMLFAKKTSRKSKILAGFAGIAIAGAISISPVSALGADPITISTIHQVADNVNETFANIDINGGGALDIARNGKVTGDDVNVNTGGILSSAGHLHIGDFVTIPNTGLLAKSLITAGTVTAADLGFGNNGIVSVTDGTMSVGDLNFGSNYNAGVLNINGGGDFVIDNLTIPASNLVGTPAADAVAVVALSGNGQLTVNDTLTLFGGNYDYTLDGTTVLHVGQINMDTGATYTQSQGTLHIIKDGGGDIFSGAAFNIAGGNVLIGSRNRPAEVHNLPVPLNLSSGNITTHGAVNISELNQSGGTAHITSQSTLTLGKFNQTGGQFTTTGKVTVTDDFFNAENGVIVDGTGVLTVQYDKLISGTGFLDSAKQHPITVNNGGILQINDYTGSGMTLTEYGILSNNIILGNGTIEGIKLIYANESLQTLGDYHASFPDIMVNGGTIDGGSALVGGVNSPTTITGGATLTLTGQTEGNIVATDGITMNGGHLMLGPLPSMEYVYGFLNGVLVTVSNTPNIIDIINGTYTLTDGIIASENTTIQIGNDSGPGGLLAANISAPGASINFDPPFGAAGDTSNASIGGLSFVDDNINASLNVGRNSMVSLGSQDAEWLRTQLHQYQNDGKGIWGENGISAALAIRTPQKLSAEGSINVDGTWTHTSRAVSGNIAKFAPDSLLVVDAAGMSGAPALSGNGTAVLEVESGAKLLVVDAAPDENITITSGFSSDSSISSEGWTSNLETNTPLLAVEGEDLGAGTYVVHVSNNGTALDNFPKLSTELAAVIDSALDAGLINPDSKIAGLRFLSRAVTNDYIGANDPALAAATIESAARMAVIGAVPQMTFAANSAAGAAITQRTSLALPNAALQSVDANGNINQGSAINSTGFALWLMPLFQSTNGFGMEAGNFDYDFNGTLGGIALGADYTFENALRAGITFNIGGGYAQGTGDLNKTTNNMNFWVIGAYLGWAANDFGLTADINFTSTYNELEQDMPQSMNMGDLNSDITAWAISTGLKAEYKFVTDYIDITPHAAFRYISLNTDSYDINSGGTVVDGDSFTQNIWTFPLGVSFGKNISLNNGWSLKPLLDLNVTPATGDIKAKTKVRFTGTSEEVELDTKMMDYITYGGTAGIEFGNDTLSLGVSYHGQFGAESSAHGVFGMFRYEF